MLQQHTTRRVQRSIVLWREKSGFGSPAQKAGLRIFREGDPHPSGEIPKDQKPLVSVLCFNLGKRNWIFLSIANKQAFSLEL